jgi:hypothetical protein
VRCDVEALVTGIDAKQLCLYSVVSWDQVPNADDSVIPGLVKHSATAPTFLRDLNAHTRERFVVVSNPDEKLTSHLDTLGEAANLSTGTRPDGQERQERQQRNRR